MKQFFKTLAKVLAVLSTLAGIAVLVYYFIKKYVKIEQVEADSDETESADEETAPTGEAADAEKPAVNRKYVNIVLDWDQVKEDAANLVGQGKQTETDAQAQPEETTEAPADEAAAAEASEEPAEESADSSIHLD